MQNTEKLEVQKYNEIQSYLERISNTIKITTESEYPSKMKVTDTNNSTLSDNYTEKNNFIVKLPLNFKNYNGYKVGLQTPQSISASLIETSSTEESIGNTNIERVSASLIEKKTYSIRSSFVPNDKKIVFCAWMEKSSVIFIMF